jgi:hypothetical protein
METFMDTSTRFAQNGETKASKSLKEIWRRRPWFDKLTTP